MNCREFEKIVVDLARQSIIDPAWRERGLAHGENCTRCTARLAGERALTSSLKVLAVEDNSMAAPDQLEVNLLSVFRQQATPSPIELPQRRLENWPRWALAAAAAILVLGLAVYRVSQTPPEKSGLIGLQPSPSVAPTIDPAVKQTASGVLPEVLPEVLPVGEASEDSLPSRSVTPRVSDHRLQVVSNRSGRGVKREPFQIRDGLTLYGGESESATDFLPLAYGANLPQMESGQLIRVRMPRSALITFGLPVNMELSNIPVKADVLIGYDGMARAIRFVR